NRNATSASLHATTVGAAKRRTGKVAQRTGARPGSGAFDAAIIDTAETAGAAGLAGRDLLSSRDPGRWRHLWMAANEGRPDFILDRRWNRPRRGCRVAYNFGETSFPAWSRARYAGQSDASCGL